MDVLLAFPPLLFLLVLVSGAGTSVEALVIGMAIDPGARRSRASSAPPRSRSPCAAMSRRRSPAASAPRVILREILPNITAPVARRLGPALHRLDPARRLGQLPRARGCAARRRLGADDHREPPGIAIQAWAVLAPAAMIALLTVGINLSPTRSPAAWALVPKTARSGDERCPGSRGRRGPVASGLTTGDPVVDDVTFTVGAGADRSGSSASPAAARRPPRSRSARLRAPGVEQPAAASGSAAKPIVGRRQRDVRACAAASSPTCRRIPATRAQPVAPDRRPVMRDAARAPRRRRDRSSRLDGSLERVELPTDRGFRGATRTSSRAASSSASRSRSRCVCDPPLVVLDEPTTGLDVDHAGAHPRGGAPPARRRRRGDGLRLARPRGRRGDRRPDRRHVRRPHRRERADGRGARAPSPPLHARRSSSAIPDHPGRAAARHPRRAVGVGERPPGCAFAPRCR